MSMRPSTARPSRKYRISAFECCRSGPSRASSSRKTVTASSNETLCFAALASAFRGSHSNTYSVYTECDGRSSARPCGLSRLNQPGPKRRVTRHQPDGSAERNSQGNGVTVACQPQYRYQLSNINCSGIDRYRLHAPLRGERHGTLGFSAITTGQPRRSGRDRSLGTERVKGDRRCHARQHTFPRLPFG